MVGGSEEIHFRNGVPASTKRIKMKFHTDSIRVKEFNSFLQVINIILRNIKQGSLYNPNLCKSRTFSLANPSSNGGTILIIPIADRFSVFIDTRSLLSLKSRVKKALFPANEKSAGG